MGAQWERKELFISFLISFPSDLVTLSSFLFQKSSYSSLYSNKTWIWSSKALSIFGERKRVGRYTSRALAGAGSLYQCALQKQPSTTPCPRAGTVGPLQGFAGGGWRAGAGVRTQLPGTDRGGAGGRGSSRRSAMLWVTRGLGSCSGSD